jgi:zona occludens toxin (predicted ATPase)
MFVDMFNCLAVLMNLVIKGNLFWTVCRFEGSNQVIITNIAFVTKEMFSNSITDPPNNHMQFNGDVMDTTFVRAMEPHNFSVEKGAYHFIFDCMALFPNTIILPCTERF